MPDLPGLPSKTPKRQRDGLSILSARPSDAQSGFPRLLLGTFAFLKNPRERLSISGPSSLANHEPPGTGPRYEYMGVGETTLQWTGQFRDIANGPSAWDQYEAVRLLEKSLQVVQYGRIRAKVWVDSLNVDLRRSDRLDYTISLKVDYAGPKARTPVHAAVQDAPATGSGIGSPDATLPPLRGESFVVPEGDTSWEAISTRFFNTPDFAQTLRDLNPDVAELGLEPGTSILTKIPTDANAAAAWKKYFKEKRQRELPHDSNPRGSNGQG